MILKNSGGSLTLPEVTISSGDNIIAPRTWDRIKSHPTVVVFLGTGRLELGSVDPAENDDNQKTPAVLSPQDPAMYLNARDTIELVSTASLSDLDAEFQDETRKTVLAAIDTRRAELTALTE